jgi:putative phosphoesterase
MRLGIISDTHDNVAAIERAVELFGEEDVGALVHCGDFIAPPVLPFFEGFEVHGVLGNNDGEVDGLELFFDDLGNGSELHGRFAELEFDGTRFGVLHGDQGMDVVDEWAESGEYDYVLYGHFHRAEERDVGGTTVINPGAHFPTVPEEHRSVVILDTGTDEVRFVGV